MVFIKVIFGSSEDMKELPSSSVHLVVTSPPYFNTPFDFPRLFNSYEEFLKMLRNVGREVFRVLQPVDSTIYSRVVVYSIRSFKTTLKLITT
jgi:DNA modification methylase